MSNPTVLIVDDEPEVLKVVERVLHNAFQVTSAVDATHAMSALRGGVFDVMLTDYAMPGMNGARLLEIARAISPATVGVMMTGVREFDAVIDAVNHGSVFRVVPKPFVPDQLTKAVGDAANAARRKVRPVTAAPSVPVETRKPVPPPAAPVAPIKTAFPVARVLIVDDSETAGEAAQIDLEDAGFSAFTLVNPMELETTVKRLTPDLVLVDVKMPVLEGDRLVRAMSKSEVLQDTPMVLFSSMPIAELQERAISCGARGYIHKDTRGEELASRVRFFLAAGVKRARAMAR